MALKNPYGLTLDQCAGFDSGALSAFSDSEAPELPEFPEESTAPAPHYAGTLAGATAGAAAAGAANVRMRIRDSAVLRSEQAAGFAFTAPPEHNPEPYGHQHSHELDHELEDEHYHDAHDAQETEDEEHEDEEEIDDEDVHDAVKLNFFVHNGYRYDGRLFKLRGPQERSQNSQPRRILQHTPAMLNLKQDFHRVYSEATYNTRPSSLRELRLSARLSGMSWASVSEMLNAYDNPSGPASPPPPPSTSALPPNPTSTMARVSLLVENDLVTKEQAARIRVASSSAPPARARAPRAVLHIGNENAPPSSISAATSGTKGHSYAKQHGRKLAHAAQTSTSTTAQVPVRKKKKPKSGDAKRSTSGTSSSSGSGVDEQRKKRQKSSNSSSTLSSASLVAPHTRPMRNVLAPSNNASNTPHQHQHERQCHQYNAHAHVQAQAHAQLHASRRRQSTESEAASGKMRPKRHQRLPAPKKKTFWKSLGLK